MKQYKFKPGDEVILIRASIEYLHKKATIYETDNQFHYKVYIEGHTSWKFANENQLEFYNIFNSPLFKAMREE